MANTKDKSDQSATKVITSKVRLSYVHVWSPVAMKDKVGKVKGEPKYSVSIIIPKSDTALVARINAAVEAAKEQGKNGKFGGKIPANLKLPLRDGDADRPDDEAYANSWFISASSGTKPDVVDKDRQPIISESEVYSGMYGRVSINFYPFNVQGCGVACGLNHIQKLADGEPLGGRGRAEDDFADDEDLT